eukprot:TRINITY_DN1713_c0_g1_i1.p1 TRINITY_DN1713_c0_g1~~TRINITY_DN1713_c0_g1_i1.p1  ORF type:complete len:129 (+),score=27.47 TRINITY_DN1713_c0_g1_i1:853-1239(+)
MWKLQISSRRPQIWLKKAQKRKKQKKKGKKEKDSKKDRSRTSKKPSGPIDQHLIKQLSTENILDVEAKKMYDGRVQQKQFQEQKRVKALELKKYKTGLTTTTKQFHRIFQETLNMKRYERECILKSFC